MNLSHLPANLREAIARVQWTEDGPYSLGKYATLLDHYLATMALDGWANDSMGDVESPGGFKSLVIVEPADLVEIADVFGAPVVGTIGNFIVSEDSMGFVYVERFATPELAREAYGDACDAYSAWLGDDGDAS